MSTIGFETHDHGACVDDAMAAAEARCAASDLRLTPIRRRVLELLLAEHRALGAYDILGHLSAEGLGAQPPVAYRALDFLVKAGLAHRIEALNAYIACSHVGADHTPAFLICRTCKAVAESEAELSHGKLGQAAKATGFTIEKVVVEAEGLCPACAAEAA